MNVRYNRGHMKLFYLNVTGCADAVTVYFLTELHAVPEEKSNKMKTAK